MRRRQWLILSSLLMSLQQQQDCEASFVFPASADRRRQTQSLQLKSNNRYYGNYKPPIRQLEDIPKAKKHSIELRVAGDTTKILEKKKYESLQHVLTKAILWKLYADAYPNIQIEHCVGDADYLPDVVTVSEEGNTILFWGESGRMSARKAVDLCTRYPDMHLVNIRWGMSLEDYVGPLQRAVSTVHKRPGRVTFGALRNKNVWEYFDQDGTVQIERDDLEWLDL